MHSLVFLPSRLRSGGLAVPALMGPQYPSILQWPPKSSNSIQRLDGVRIGLMAFSIQTFRPE